MQILRYYLLLVVPVFANKVLIPKANGPYDVTIRTSELVDHSRTRAEESGRRLMISVFSPTMHTTPSCRSPDFLPKVAKYYGKEFSDYYNFTVDFSRLVLPYCSDDVTYGGPSRHNTLEQIVEPTMPLVIFSPGSAATRFRYNAINAALASEGFLAITIDHPYTVDIIEFPDGTTVKMPPNVTENFKYIRKHLNPRVKDVLFILDSITTNATLKQLLFPTAQPNLKHVGIWGHSFGGATAAQVVYEDDRLAGGINLDGSMVGAVVDKGLSKPFMLWASVGHTREGDSTWSKFYSKLTGFKRNLMTKHTLHNSFTDGPLLADLLHYSKNKTDLGSIGGRRDIEILSSYARDFFRFALLGDKKGLVKGPSKKFPEVRFIP